MPPPRPAAADAPVLVLGLETSCDETGAAVVADGRWIRSNVIASQTDLHARYRGVVPELASRAHAERILPVVRRALSDAGLGLDAIDAVAVGHRPGLIGSLLVGVAAAKALAWSLGKPLVGVDHVHAHLYAGYLAEAGGGPPSDALFPALGLVVSGGHTAIYRCRSPIELTRLGGTIDDAAGEAFDKAATILGLPYPGGPNLDRLASTPGANDRAHDFPISRLSPTSLDFSFSGLKTALLYAVRGVPGPDGVFPREAGAPVEPERSNLAAAFRRAVVRAIILKLERAMDRLAGEGAGVRSLLTGGGVTANTLLRSELARLARARALELRLPAPELCVDNAAMIAGLGHRLLEAGRTSDLSLQALPTVTG